MKIGHVKAVNFVHANAWIDSELIVHHNLKIANPKRSSWRRARSRSSSSRRFGATKILTTRGALNLKRNERGYCSVFKAIYLLKTPD
jgi:hypothetical protein